MGKSKLDRRGRVTLPRDIRAEFGLKAGEEVRIERDERGILIRPLTTKEKFVRELEGCITEANQVEKIEPSKLKGIWGLEHAHD
ncbi:MAG: AbrB/MazE/SpoVT family DNA-binding domain-containing protein [Candidatus Hydrothermarchaeales archaeon]